MFRRIFVFQKNPTRKIGWEFWLKGKPNNEVLVDGIIKKAPVKPYRKLNSKLIPSVKRSEHIDINVETNFYNHGTYTGFKYTSRHLEKITANVIDETFEKATKYLKEKVVSYIWNLPRKDIVNWTISTWSKHVSNGYH